MFWRNMVLPFYFTGVAPLHWKIDGVISLLGPGSLPRLTQEKSQELNDALLKTAISILNRDHASNVQGGELDVTCELTNVPWRSVPECRDSFSTPDEAVSYLLTVTGLESLTDSEVFLGTKRGVVVFVQGLHRFAASVKDGVEELRLRYMLGLTVKAARGARRRIVRAVSRGVLPGVERPLNPDDLARVILDSPLLLTESKQSR